MLTKDKNNAKEHVMSRAGFCTPQRWEWRAVLEGQGVRRWRLPEKKSSVILLRPSHRTGGRHQRPQIRKPGQVLIIRADAGPSMTGEAVTEQMIVGASAQARMGQPRFSVDGAAQCFRCAEKVIGVAQRKPVPRGSWRWGCGKGHSHQIWEQSLQTHWNEGA